MIKLAFRNLKSKPFRTVATVLAIAVAVAMIFCMLSFKGAVYNFIFASETAMAGNSDIRIATNSSSDRVLDITQSIESIDGIKTVCPSLGLYALLNGEYVQVRGFEDGKLEALQKIQVLSGSVQSIGDRANIDNIVISQSAAEHFGLNVGDRISLSLGNRSIQLFVGVISANSGYFLDDSPYLFVGLIKKLSTLILPVETLICNEIYISVESGTDVDGIIDKLAKLPAFAQMQVEVSKKTAYIQEQTDSLTAPVVLAGAAVLMLAIACIVLLLLMSEKEKVLLISKLSVVGATKKQMLTVFLTEAFVLAAAGSLVGMALASGVFVALLKITLSSTLVFGVSAGFLVLSAFIGFAVSVLSSALPIARAFGGTIRENQIAIKERPKWQKPLPIGFALLTLICVVLEFTVPSATAYVSVLSLIFAFATLGTMLPVAMRGTARLTRTIKDPSVKIASVAVSRQKRFSRSVTMLGIGMTVSMLLFMAWSLTKNVFGAYVSDFADMAFVNNIQASADIDEFKSVEGVKSATKLVWSKSTLDGKGFEKTMNVLGSKDVLEMVNFEFITPKDVVKQHISSNQPYIAIDIALKELYGVDVGDVLTMTLEGKPCEVTVAGILKHNLFSGNYVVVSSETIEILYDIKPDTVLVIADKDIKTTAGNLRAGFAERNYYVVEALEAFRWEMESTTAVFDLIGTLAVVVAVFIFIVTVAASIVGRSAAERDRTALLNAGMSKNGLLAGEVFEYALIALVSFVLSFAWSVLLTSCLIHALRLFGLYFEFMYEAWVIATVGAVMSVCYIAVPVASNFKKRYNIKR